VLFAGEIERYRTWQPCPSIPVDDRSPTVEEIHKIIEYPDRGVKPIIFTMASYEIRVGAWDYLR